MLVWEEFSSRSGWDFCRFDASMRKIQTQEWVRFAQVWCNHEKDSDARVAEICEGLMLIWEGFRRRSERDVCRFGARMRRIQTQEWVRLVHFWCLFEKDSDARVVEVCVVLMLVWEGFRRRSGWGLCRFDACMRRIQKQEWVRFAQVWCKHEKDSDAGVGEVCAGLMQAWEGFRCKSGRDLCRFDARMRKIQTQEWARCVQIWCTHEKDSDARVGEVCAGLMLVWERFRRRVGEVCAGLMLVWEGFRRRSGWDLCRFDACMRTIKTQEWMRFVQLWCV